jgi:hypothetical protein
MSSCCGAAANRAPSAKTTPAPLHAQIIEVLVPAGWKDKADRPVEALGMPTAHPSLRFRVARMGFVCQENYGT